MYGGCYKFYDTLTIARGKLRRTDGTGLVARFKYVF